MSGPIFVRDAQGTPLMPMAAAHARRLLQSGKVLLQPHHAFTIIHLTQTVENPKLQPVVLGVTIHLHTAELFLLAEGDHDIFPLLHLIVDLQTDMPRRLRRRAAHRHRRKARGRYRASRRHGIPFHLRRPSRARSARTRRGYRSRMKNPKARLPHHSPTMQWRAEAIERVIHALRELVPISRVIICEPLRGQLPYQPSDSQETLRQRLIAAYGGVNVAGERVARCAYCGTTEGQIEVDHIIPQSRGGTDRRSNLVLACATCNARKGDRTPQEAGMSLQIPQPTISASSARARPYRHRTAQLLTARLNAADLHVTWQSSADDSAVASSAMFQALVSFASNPWVQRCSFIARPIARPRKQVFSARNYPLSTPERGAFSRVGQTIKRRIQVNNALARWHEGERVVVKVVSATEEVPEQAEQIIKLGMLCEGRRAGQIITGIVGAIHSDSRLTLLVPRAADAHHIVWRRIVVGVQRHLRVLSSDRVVFLPAPDTAQENSK